MSQIFQRNFNTSYVVVQRCWCYDQYGYVFISIHLMLWFNAKGDVISSMFLVFQYILCCGSTQETVTVFDKNVEFQYILCCGSTGVGGT